VIRESKVLTIMSLPLKETNTQDDDTLTTDYVLILILKALKEYIIEESFLEDIEEVLAL
jgi:hypothetical protein